MTHFGVLCPTATGHINSLLPLAHELTRRGHRVTFFVFADGFDRVTAAGCDCTIVAESEFPKGSIAQFDDRLGELSQLEALKFGMQYLAHTYDVSLRHAPAVIQQAGVDALIVDQVSLEGGTIADILQIPYISFCSAIVLNADPLVPPITFDWLYNPGLFGRIRNWVGARINHEIIKPLAKTINHHRQRFGLPLYKYNNDAYSPLLQISQQPAEFEFPRSQLPANFHFTGPHHYTSPRPPIPFPWDQINPQQPLIYASLGTLQNRQQWMFEAIAQACQDLPVQLVISLGNRDRAIPSLPGHPIVVPYAPQLELLQQASLVITHAGLNTTLEALTQGVPLVAIPITSDQPGVAARIVWSGAGVMIPPHRLTVVKLKQAIIQVLQQPSYRRNARRLQQAIARSGGVVQAANLIETAVGERQNQRLSVNSPPIYASSVDSQG
ncbi:MAG: glycosyl transferase family 1 [Alkalinema sp. CACIAM 70d]|nr:MAG: glycosyl transferase family 1 [Alkalinema sp. CACIAM 70d]